jgi:prepilin-type N-terminal cleavage/methylation domain-containing protein
MTGRARSSNDAARERPPTLANLKRALVDGQKGVALVEVLVAVAIIGITLVVFLSAVSTGSIGVAKTEEQVTAENLARSQLEYTKSQTYLAAPASYDTVTPPAGYAVSAEAASIPDTDSSIQMITVTVTRDGETLVTVEDFKVDR